MRLQRGLGAIIGSGAIIGMLSLISATARAALPPLGNLASQTLQAFIDHWNDSEELRRLSGANANEAMAATTLVTAAEVATRLAASTLTLTTMYGHVGEASKPIAFDELKAYLQILEEDIDDQVTRCNWVVAHSRRQSVISEAERLRADLRTFKTYVAHMRAMRAPQPLPRFDDLIPKQKT